MAHAVTLSPFRSGRMPPQAVALAVLVHALVALALWQMSLHQPLPLPPEEPIEVTVEPDKPAPPKPDPPPPAQRTEPTQPAPPAVAGLRPPADIISDKPTQVPRPPVPQDPAHLPQHDALAEAVPSPEPEPAPPAAKAFEVPKPAPPPLAPPQARGILPSPPPRPTPPPPREQSELRPSPLTSAQRRPPREVARLEDSAPSPFVNPADAYNRSRIADNYLWEVARRIVGYHYNAHVEASQGLTVVRVVIARDGRLLDVQVARSSGYAVMDQGVIAGVRAGAPYSPLPPEIQGSSATFTLPLVSVNHP